jgi:predicted lipoprotein
MNKRIFTLFLATAAASVMFFACKKSDSSGSEPTGGFDKTGMLTNYADNMILPGYTSLQQALGNLETAVNNFIDNPTTANQQALMPVFKAAYLQYERTSVCQFGPAETVLFSNFMNTFPPDTAAIEANITAGSYTLNTQSSMSRQGFPALDYLLFSAHAVQDFTGSNAANRKKYVHDLTDRMKTLTATVIADWQNNYRAQFVSNTKTDVGSPIGYLINQLAFEMDQLKGPRIGWPFGKQSGGVVFADKCEAYYSGISLALAVENLTSLKNYYTGGGSGKGMSDYVIALGKQQLNTDIINQFDVALAKLNAIPDPLAASFTNNAAKVNDAYKEVQLLLTLIKTDLASATGVRITYQDSDGD